MLEKLKIQKGVTLVALMLTIVVLLMLTGIIVYNVINFNIIDNAASAKMKADLKQVYEQVAEELNNKRLDGEDVTILEGKLKDFAELQNVEEDIINLLYVSKGEVTYILENVESYCENDEEKIAELLKYLEELSIEEFKEVVATTDQVTTKVELEVQGGQEAVKTEIHRTIDKYEYNVSIVLDLSASMLWAYNYTGSNQNYFIYDHSNETQRLYIAKQAINSFIDNFFATRTGAVQVITFNYDNNSKNQNRECEYSGTMQVLNSGLENAIAKNATEATNLKNAVSAIEITSNLGTYYNYALNYAKTQLTSNFDNEERTETQTTQTANTIEYVTTNIHKKNMIIFISDGAPSDNENTIRQTANEIKKSMDIYTVGFTTSNDILNDMASTDENAQPYYYTASNATELINSLSSILDSSDVTGGQDEVVSSVEVKNVTTTTTEKGTEAGDQKTIIEYPIEAGTILDKTSPIEIWSGSTLLESYYVNNLPESITYENGTIYWDLSKLEEKYLNSSEKLQLKFEVIDLTYVE